MSDFLTKLFSTLLTVVIAVLVSGGLWIGANLLFNQLRTNFVRYRALIWGLLGFVGGVLLSGNRLTVASTSEGGTIARLVAWGWLPLLLALATSAIGTVLATVSSPRTRLAVGAGGLGVTGLVAGLLIVDSAQPTVSIASLVVSTAVGTGIGATAHRLSSRTSPGAIFLGAALGWMVGAWAIPELGSGTTVWSGIALLVPSALLGTRSALLPIPDQTERNQLDQRSRSAIFLGPALLFIFAALVVPTVRTLYLSLLDRKSESFVGIDNYISIFKDPKALNLTEWQAIFGSRLFWAALICFIAFIILAVRARRQTGHLVELGSASSGPLIAGIVLLGFAVFTALRGTLINNLWWVLAVTLLSTSFGLAIAVLADGVRLERVAKAIIFMPMAVSLVGASVVWRFMYIARDSSKSQTGVINALWVGLGRLSTGS
ncbi:MAG: carbohydrate ABC transporter permease, partial [Ilumatobacteraceae bacterium]